MTRDYGIYSQQTAQEIHNRVLGPHAAPGGRDQQQDWIFAKLTEDLEAAGDPYENYTTAEAQVIRYTDAERSGESDPNLLDMELTTGNENKVTVVNRFTGMEVGQDTLVLLRLHPFRREYMIVMADCEPLP